MYPKQMLYLSGLLKIVPYLSQKRKFIIYNKYYIGSKIKNTKMK